MGEVGRPCCERGCEGEGRNATLRAMALNLAQAAATKGIINGKGKFGSFSSKGKENLASESGRKEGNSGTSFRLRNAKETQDQHKSIELPAEDLLAVVAADRHGLHERRW